MPHICQAGHSCLLVFIRYISLRFHADTVLLYQDSNYYSIFKSKTALIVSLIINAIIFFLIMILCSGFHLFYTWILVVQWYVTSVFGKVDPSVIDFSRWTSRWIWEVFVAFCIMYEGNYETKSGEIRQFFHNTVQTWYITKR